MFYAFLPRVSLDIAYFAENSKLKIENNKKIIKKLLFTKGLFISDEQCNRRWLKKKKKRLETRFDAKHGRNNRYPKGTLILASQDDLL